ncbi:hypothetical protein [Pseudoxanthomonas mexicana]|uniref:hypothetical protein n=1 Tax=Pseudoxanthomonas mexicana TaxID=128785 RepID=UPI0024E1CEFB|nr:hypothetical protein [Pseudoxanthomonas mexicana]
MTQPKPVGEEDDSYEAFLRSFDPNDYPALMFASSEPYVHDPLALERLIRHGSIGDATLARDMYRPGTKHVGPEEVEITNLEFFRITQTQNSTELRARLRSAGISSARIDRYMEAFATLWVGTRSQRLHSPQMLEVMASIVQHDLAFHRGAAGRHVVNKPYVETSPLFSPEQMAAVFQANSDMLETALYAYSKHLPESDGWSINRVYARRGMHRVTDIPPVWSEQQYLNSYSLTVTVPEQFAQTYTSASRRAGTPMIVSACLPSIQGRIVAFAGFVEGMSVDQAELVVAPPVREIAVRHLGTHGSDPAIKEYVYD